MWKYICKVDQKILSKNRNYLLTLSTIPVWHKITMWNNMQMLLITSKYSADPYIHRSTHNKTHMTSCFLFPYSLSINYCLCVYYFHYIKNTIWILSVPSFQTHVELIEFNKIQYKSYTNQMHQNFIYSHSCRRLSRVDLDDVIYEWRR